MHGSRLGVILGIPALFIIFICGCSSGHPVGGGGGTPVTFTFTGGTPTAAAAQIGSGSFAAATIQSGQVTVSLPSSTASYAIAYVCPPVTVLGDTLTSEFVIQATGKDGTAFTVSCQGFAATANVSMTVNATAIPGATNVLIRGPQATGANLGSTSGTISVPLAMGTGNVDVSFAAVNSSNNVLAVKIVRGQTVPGTFNGGNTVVFATTDAVSTQSLAVNNVPAGDVNPPAVAVEYFTANGTAILLDNTSATSYPTVPPSATQSGDFYSYEANTVDTATSNQAIGITQNTTSGGGFQTLVLPVPWSFSGPAAAIFPIFTFNYTGFNGQAEIEQEAAIEWQTSGTTSSQIRVTATASFQNGADTITIPNLTSLSGFLPSAPATTTINWVADIMGGTVLNFPATPPSNGTISFVQNKGTFTQP